MSRTRPAFVVGIILTLVALGWVGVRILTANAPTANTGAVVVPVSTVVVATEWGPASGSDDVMAGPAGASSGVPTGYVQTEAGARAAAVGWVSSLGTLVRLGPLATADAVRAVTSTRIADTTISSFRAERDRFRELFGADPSAAIWIESPLAVTATDWAAEQAVVRVWSQLVFGVGSEATVRVMWRTHTIRLVWEGDDWKVDDVTRTEGPTPQTLPENLPSPGGDFAQVAGWTPAVLAGSNVGDES
jgi:hypothetical protein